MPTSSLPGTPALPRRLLALLYDTLLVIPLIGVTVALATVVSMALSGNSAAGDYYQLHPQWVQLIAFGCVVTFCTAFWHKSGQTLGMQAWRVKLVDSSGAPPTVGRCVLRCAGALLSAACLGLGYAWCLVDRRGRYWHDYFSGTELLLLPKAAKRAAQAKPVSESG
ncbi:RDD family protein [Kineobactrum salinum]|uniref:RDD family protein n=1 Tax=Kineobactrum salinum TaxID=2708301 RepID=A0A6C0U740_9GAMM|nr:RDD family protein [Kineobactrum salinum]QIB66767.1 RDD family protein [Kineobactrum salinum]